MTDQTSAGHTMADPVVPLLLGAHWYEDAPGGLNRYLADLFTALDAAGLCPRATVAGPAANAPVDVVPGTRFDRPLPIRLVGFSRAATRAASTSVTVVDAHFALYAFWPVVAGRLRRLPLVVHFQGPWAEESVASGETSGWRIPVKRWVERSVYRRAVAVVVLSEAFKRLLVRDYGVPPWAIEVIPPGVDLARFAPGDRADARAVLDLSPEAQIVIVVRRLVPRMGLDILIDAWARLQPTLPRAQLVVVGDGPERHQLQELARRSGIGASVRFLGRVDDATLARCYQAADLSVVPTAALEGFGLVVLESLACGTPVVVTDSGGLPEGVAGLDLSLIVPAGDADALASRLRTALDGTQAPPAPTRCRAHAESFSWPMVAEHHRAVYSRAVHPAPRKLRVVYIDHCARLSGGELALLRLLPALEGVDAHVVLGEDGRFVDKPRQAGISVEVLAIADTARSVGRERVRPGRLPAASLLYTAAHVVRLAARLRRLRPDLVHTNSLKAALYGGAAARLASVPVVWHVRDRITDDYLPPFAQRLVMTAGRLLPSRVIANSRSTLETLGPAGEGGVAIASPLGFGPIPRVKTIRHQPLRLGIVGRLDPWKGQHVFLDAFAKAFPTGDEEAVIVGSSLFGDNAYELALERQAADLGVDGRVEFRGFRDNVEDKLRRLDVLVHASTIPEPFGQVVVEGMAMALPVVAAGAGGPAEVVNDGADGLLYPPGDVTALAQALQLLAADPMLRERLGAAAVLRAQDFTADRIAPRVMAVYQDILASDE
jgi:glycosyltransferase involved in cell wall biosynthesis